MKALKTQKLVIYCLLMLSTFQLTAQSDNFKSQRVRMAAFNIGVNGLLAGIGSLINKKSNENSLKTFCNGFYKGAIGGTISHVGLSMSHLVQTKENIAYAWPARFVNSMGSSIVQNAAENNKMFERLHFNLYIVRLEYLPYKKKFTTRLFTSSIYGILAVGRGSRFGLGKSLKSGILYFESDDGFKFSFGSGRGTGQVSSIGMQSNLEGENFYRIYAEEVAHIEQYDRKVAGNAFLTKLDSKWKENSKFYNKLSKYIYFDLNGPLFWVAYGLENGNGKCNNFFEQEAVNYSNRRVLCN